jgi:protein involved in polysaccharide export with SLBB domain
MLLRIPAISYPHISHRLSLTIWWISACLTSAALSSCESSGNKPLPPPAQTTLGLQVPNPAIPLKPVLQPGDSMEILVEEDPSFNGNYPVREGGYILIPKLGRVLVAGLDRDQAEKQLTSLLQKSQLIKAKVFVELVKAKNGDLAATLMNSPKITVFFTGNVAKPGTHVLPIINGRSVGVYEALLISGGLSRFGNVGKVEILRIDPATGRRLRSVVDLRPVRDGTQDDTPLGEGDIVNVNERVFGF